MHLMLALGTRHVGLMAGSYVSLVTALLVVNWSNPLAWILPTVIGTPLIARATARADRHVHTAAWYRIRGADRARIPGARFRLPSAAFVLMSQLGLTRR